MSFDFLKSLNEAKLHRHMTFEMLDISIEVPADGYRRGVNKRTGEAWAHKIPAHYGYIKGTHSPDGEHLDCYVRKNPKKGSKVYVVHQMTVDGSKFDEDKVMLGYSSRAEAVREFKAATFKPSTMFGGVTEFTMDHFRVAAYQASKSHAMLTGEDTYASFKTKGLLTSNIKSPLMIARRVSESLSEGLGAISGDLLRDDVQESLDRALEGGAVDVRDVLDLAHDHYQDLGGLICESEFRAVAQRRIMERDALMLDVDDLISSEIEEAADVGDALDLEISEGLGDETQVEEISEMSDDNYAVVVYTQKMKNLGESAGPNWATAGSSVVLVQEDVASWTEARALAAKVVAGQVPVSIDEGSHVLGVDVITMSEYRFLYEETQEAAEISETLTDEEFFERRLSESLKLAGVKPGVVESSGTPSVHETRERLARLTASYGEALAAQAPQIRVLGEDELSHARIVAEATMAHNPGASRTAVCRAVALKLYEDADLYPQILDRLV